MILGNRPFKSSTLIGGGQLSLAAAIVAQRFVNPPGDFWQSFVAGVAGVLVGLSLVLNVRGLVLARQERPNGS